MRYTARERQLISLIRLWLFLFGAGAVVTTVAHVTSAGAALYAAAPLMVFVWAGQIVLALCARYFLDGIRDNEHAAGILWWYKMVAGSTMLLMLASRGFHPGPAVNAAAGGLLDFGMGASTMYLWFRARRSRYQREPLDAYAKVMPIEEPQGPAFRRHQFAIGACGVLCAVASLGLFVTLMAIDVRKDPTFMIASGNAVALFAALGFAAIMAGDAPRRRGSDLDILLMGMGVASVTLLYWATLVPTAQEVRLGFLVGGGVLLTAVGVTWALGYAALRSQRPTQALGPFAHQLCERFADVLIRGDVEVVSARDLADRTDAWLAQVPEPQRRDIRRALFACEYAPLLHGRLPMSRMGRFERAEFFTRAFRFGPMRDLLRVRSLLMRLYYSDPRAREQIGADADSATPAPASVGEAPPATVDVDVCVVGSGAGGAVLAERLAARGLRVVIVEEGGVQGVIRDGGLGATRDRDVEVVQGSGLGGTTAVGTGLAWQVRPQVLHEWDQLGCELPREELADAYQTVLRELGGAVAAGVPCRAATAFADGCRALNKPVDWVEPLQGMSVGRSFLPRAVAAGARVYTGTRAVSIEHDGSRARAVQCDRDGTPVRITAGRVVVSAGPVHSSLLLRRSGITRNVGTRVGFNVVTWVHAEFREPMDAESQRSAFHLDSRFSIRTVRLAPETFAASMPAWYDDHFDNMLRYRYFATAAVTVRTLATGSVRPESDGPGRIDFALPISDLRKMRTGIREACRIWLAAGAARVLPPTTEAVAFTHPDQLERLDELIVEAEDLVLTSTAPQGGNPMSDDAEVGAVDTRFRVFGFDNLHVTDGSIVPSPVADGPQLTIMALAHIAAQRMPQ